MGAAGGGAGQRAIAFVAVEEGHRDEQGETEVALIQVEVAFARDADHDVRPHVRRSPCHPAIGCRRVPVRGEAPRVPFQGGLGLLAIERREHGLLPVAFNPLGGPGGGTHELVQGETGAFVATLEIRDVETRILRGRGEAQRGDAAVPAFLVARLGEVPELGCHAGLVARHFQLRGDPQRSVEGQLRVPQGVCRHDTHALAHRRGFRHGLAHASTALVAQLDRHADLELDRSPRRRRRGC